MIYFMLTLSNIKKFDYYLIEGHFKFVFIDNQYSTYIKPNLFDNKTMVSWKNFLEKLIDDLKNKGYIFNHIEEMKIIKKANKMDMS